MRGRRNSAIALATIVAWLLGVEVLPNLHLAFHADDHTHGHGGTILAYHQRLAHALAHANGEHHDEPRDARESKELAFDHAPHGHIAGGISHRAIALLDPPPPITTPIALPHADTWQHAAPNERIASTHAARPSARGPPAKS